ncbi:VOC family protein [Telmatospirillum sp. J64-1]|uniref:VOC family protein n=1 Tax=Telmatospirillum sp. J64-1 TaxID=2502183 RepID=UPI00115CB777|nr:VOC family protein [Telmatospirillum sp. J64-1]
MAHYALDPCIVTRRIKETRDFYTRHFKAEILFDSPWYLVLRLGEEEGAPEIVFMLPQQGQTEFTGQGVAFNIRVDDVDEEYRRLVAAEVTVLLPLEDHDWGDRGFTIADPNGVALYFYTPISPEDQFHMLF